MKEHLKHFFPFLKTEFRKLEEGELQSELVFIELFPNEDIELWKLRTIFCYQNAEINPIILIEDSKGNIEAIQEDGTKLKVKRNAKV